MILLKAATVTVSDLDAAMARYTTYLDYNLVEQGTVPAELAQAWSSPGVEGQAYAVLQPASGKDIFLRLIEQPPVPGFKALRTYGWNAIEICVTDVMQVFERLKDSPFEIIGPPRENPGLANIHPMQIKGPDEEVVFLTQINEDTPPYKLPRASSLIDQIFIMVIGCSDMKAACAWFEKHVGLSNGEAMEIAYTMLAKAYGKDLTTQYQLTTMTHDFDVFLEVDQYPDAATVREKHDGMLPPGCALTSFIVPNFEQLLESHSTSPKTHAGMVYNQQRSVILSGPDGALIEIIEA